MINEGIMALPQGLPMLDEEEGAEQQPTVTSFDSYDAAQTALGQVNPNELAMLKESLRQNMAELQLTPSQLAALIEIFEYISQNPGEYPTIRAELIRNDFVDEEDLPEDYDPEFLGAMLAVLNELQMTMVQGAQAPMQGPPIDDMGPMPMAQGGLADVAAYMSAQGRNGDTMLAHITPQEAELLRSQGGAGTINPVTGLPEFFLKKVFRGIKKAVKSVANVVKKALQSPIGRILATVALATVLGPAGVGLSMGMAAGLAGAGTTLMAGGSVKEALVAGAMGYIGGGGTIMGTSPMSAVGQYLPGAAGSALNTGLSTGVIGTGVGMIAGMDPKQALQMGVTSGLSAAALQGISNSQQQQLLKDAQFNREMGLPLTAQQQAAVDAAAAQAQQISQATGQGQPTSQAGVGQIGATGTAQDMLGGGINPQSAGVGFRAPTEFGPQDFSTTVGGTAPTTNYNLTPVGFSGEPGFQYAPTLGARDFSRAAGGVMPNTNYSLTPNTAPATTQPTGIMDRMVSGAKDIYNEYLSPDRAGLPADAGFFRKYGPLAAVGTGVIAAAGGMEGKPADENPAFDRNYTGFDYIEDNPDKFRGGLDRYQPPSTPPGVVVPSPQYSTIPMGPPSTTVPMGLTQSPAGVAQPYNVAGLYGVPLIYGQRPTRMAKGGELRPTEFPRKTGPINGPGTGTSDSIPAMLSDGEFVFTAKAVRNAGGGSRRKGAARMYKLMKRLEGGPVKANANG